MPEILNEDERQLKLLAMFHYIVAGTVALFSCLFILHIVIGVIAIASPQTMADKDGSLPPPFFGWMFVIMGGIFVFMGWALAICMVIAGRFLVRKKKYLFCMVIAAFSCMFAPFGTVLGVFTIVVLQRPSIKELFKQNAL